MLPLTAVLRELLSAGLSGEQLIAAFERVEQSVHGNSADTELARRRAIDRERKKKIRGNSVDSTDTKNDVYVDKKESKKKESKHTRASPIPADFALTEADLACARKRAFDDHRINAELERFKDHAAANDRRQVDWHAAWRMWVNSPFQQKEAANGHRGRMETDPRSDNPCKPGTVAWWTRERLAGRA